MCDCASPCIYGIIILDRKRFVTHWIDPAQCGCNTTISTMSCSLGEVIEARFTKHDFFFSSPTSSSSCPSFSVRSIRFFFHSSVVVLCDNHHRFTDIVIAVISSLSHLMSFGINVVPPFSFHLFVFLSYFFNPGPCVSARERFIFSSFRYIIINIIIDSFPVRSCD